MKIHCVAIILIFANAVQKNCALQLLKPDEQKLSEDGKLNFAEAVTKYGHTTEEKHVVTEDGYILTMYHIPGNKTRAVLLIHGNTLTGSSWVMRGNTSLAITLANQRYDVWVINLRGSTYSRTHRHLNADTQKDEFFDFSFYEQGVYDLPATIDFILQETGQEQVLAIGFSVGTTLMYIMGAEKPEYNDKIKIGISLAPICFLEYLRGFFSLAPFFAPTVINEMDRNEVREIVRFDTSISITQALCLNPFGYEICVRLLLSAIFGYDLDGFEPEFLPTLVGHWPGGSSVKTFKHLFQNIQSRGFLKYDYGRSKNLEVYKSLKPPPIDLSKVTMNSALFVGREDLVATVRDSERLKASLPNVVHYQVLPYDKFNHGDFVYDRYLTEHLYPYLFPVIEKYI